MDRHSASVSNDQGVFADNVIHFVRLLRASGMPVGPAQALGALRAVEAAGIGQKEDFYWVLHACLVTRRDQRPVFDQAFAMFWQKRGLVEKMMSLLLPETRAAPEKIKPKAGAQRVAEALTQNATMRRPEQELVEIDMTMTMSDVELLKTKDFAQMSAAEIAEAMRRVRQLVMPMDEIRTRRFRPHHAGKRIDPRATLRQALRWGGNLVALARRAPKTKHPPLVALVDISGSMSSYSRVLLHFLHALTAVRPPVHTFLFGTRLTNITRELRTRDVDEALARCGTAAQDWEGGTRIGSCLETFNKRWSRRVLGQGAIVLLISDGLERETGNLLEKQMERLHLSSRRFIWLNPLLRFDGFEARAAGIRTMLPHVDEFRPVHNLATLAELVQALDIGAGASRRTVDPRRWLAAAAA